MRIVAFAYACEPSRGSEPGSGWAWARMVARFGETWVITRANNRDAIEAASSRLSEKDHLHFVYVDLPAWSRSWKKGSRGIHFYYLLWQIAAVRKARALHRELSFGLVWHLTFANAWFGSAASLTADIPFVYGPVGGGIRTSWRLMPALGLRGGVHEILRTAAQVAGRYFNPLARMAWRRASLILVQNRETKSWFPSKLRKKVEVFPNVVLDDIFPPRQRQTSEGRCAIFAGNLLPLKGIALALRALPFAPGWRLVVFGDGWDEARLRRIAHRRGVGDRVRFAGRIHRDELLRFMSEQGDAFLFPSIHDEAGWVVAEARACGLPVICLDRGGPPLLGGTAVRVTSMRSTARALAAALPEAGGPAVPPVNSFALAVRSIALRAVLADHGIVARELADGERHALVVHRMGSGSR